MIEVKNLTKVYGSLKAVSDLSFHIDKGHVYGFLGPNGAGKSTTMNIMTGCLAATSGEVRIGGYDIFEEPEKAKKLIGYLPEIPPLYVTETPREYLNFVADAKGVAKKEKKEAIEKVIEETHIGDVADKLIKNLSKGYRQRVGIAQALIGDPEVIILDEPTVGLDPMQIIEIRDLIRELGEKHTVILSSHILSEVQEVCEKVLIIYRGRLVAFDEPEKLSGLLQGGASVEIGVRADAETLSAALSGLAGLRESEIREEKTGKTTAVLHTDRQDQEEVSLEVSRMLREAGIDIFRLNAEKASLEDIFIELTSQEGGAGTDGALTAEKEESAADSREESAEAADSKENEESVQDTDGKEGAE